MNIDLRDPFWTCVEVGEPDQCWTWKLTPNRDGYGRLRVEGRKMMAHRRAYELAIGPIPKGLRVLHTCDNPPCCNPNHLWTGTQLQNIEDRNNKGRTSLIARNRGEIHGMAKLTDHDVNEIRALYRSGEYLQRELAAQYGVSRSLISMIVNNKLHTL